MVASHQVEDVALQRNPTNARDNLRAQSGGGYDLTWNTMDGGGATFSTGGTYSLGGTIGQFDARKIIGGTYTLNGGFWVDFLGNRIMLPLILK